MEIAGNHALISKKTALCIPAVILPVKTTRRDDAAIVLWQEGGAWGKRRLCESSAKGKTNARFHYALLSESGFDEKLRNVSDENDTRRCGAIFCG